MQNDTGGFSLRAELQFACLAVDALRLSTLQINEKYASQVGWISEAHPPKKSGVLTKGDYISDMHSTSGEVERKKPSVILRAVAGSRNSLEKLFCLLFRRFCNYASLRAE